MTITLYGFHTREAMRVAFDYDKLDQYPLVDAWASKSKSKEKNPLEPLIDEMVRGGRNLFASRRGSVGPLLPHAAPYGRRRLGSKGGEVFRYGSDRVCQGCPEPFFTDK